MSAEILVGVSAVAEAERKSPRAWPLRIGAWVQNTIIILTLAMMVLLPIWESLARLLKFTFGITSNLSLSAATTFVQLGTLVVALIGAAIAARENRLLALATAN